MSSDVAIIGYRMWHMDVPYIIRLANSRPYRRLCNGFWRILGLLVDYWV